MPLLDPFFFLGGHCDGQRHTAGDSKFGGEMGTLFVCHCDSVSEKNLGIRITLTAHVSEKSGLMLSMSGKMLFESIFFGYIF